MSQGDRPADITATGSFPDLAGTWTGALTFASSKHLHDSCQPIERRCGLCRGRQHRPDLGDGGSPNGRARRGPCVAATRHHTGCAHHRCRSSPSISCFWECDGDQASKPHRADPASGMPGGSAADAPRWVIPGRYAACRPPPPRLALRRRRWCSSQPGLQGSSSG